jgi:hypothetical protein
MGKLVDLEILTADALYPLMPVTMETGVYILLLWAVLELNRCMAR